ncbi:MAG: pyridoxine 5'-phosphate synthase [Brachymonas sp.]
MAHPLLSVNVNKVALVRNTRHVGYPGVTRAAERCLKAGAAGITVHPRPDERHIRRGDVFEIAELMRLWPDREFNIEGNPFHNLMEFIRAVKPHQATFVPDSESQSTSDHGWSFPQDAQQLKPLIDECHALGVRVSLFMDPVAEQMAACKAVGADRVELYTETWASAFDTPTQAQVLAQFVQAAEAARAVGLGVNAGHDLTQANLRPFIAAIPFIAEVSIGHAFVSDALEVGYAQAVKGYLAALSAHAA